MSRSGGFTILEVIIAMAILAVATSGAFLVLMATGGSYRQVRLVADTQESARLALIGIADDLREAGLGFSSGQVGIAPGGSVRRVPAIYSGANLTVSEPGGQTVVTNSIFILEAGPSSIGVSAMANGPQAVVATVTQGLPLGIACASSQGASVDCNSAPAFSPLRPLIVGDLRNAILVSPTALSSSSGGPQSLTYAEQSAIGYSPDPKAPFGLMPGAVIAAARLVHWYIKVDPATGAPYLARSFPTINPAALGSICQPTDNPLVDETNGGTAVGQIMSVSPVDSFQIRFVTDPNGTDDPSQYSLLSTIGPCDTGVPATVRSIRIEVVSRALEFLQAGSNGGSAAGVYATPAFEGVSPSTGVQDAYPRTALTMTVVPRNLEGGRL